LINFKVSAGFIYLAAFITVALAAPNPAVFFCGWLVFELVKTSDVFAFAGEELISKN
jgi:hypothetical protein